MLEELYVKNLVIFEEATLPLTCGLNVVSGETGAGKSLITGAISLALGCRASNELIRKGCDTATVSAIFTCPQKGAASKLIKELDVDVRSDEPVIFERRIAEGRSSKLSLCGKPVSASTVQPLADAMLDIAAQNEHTRLLESSYQRYLLDMFGSISHEKFSVKFRQALELLHRLESGDAQKERVRLELERVRYKLAKISEFGFDPANDPQLEERIKAMSNAEEIRRIADDGAMKLYEGDDAVTDQVGSVLRSVEEIVECGDNCTQAYEFLQTAQAALEDAARSLRDAAEDADCTPQKLDATIERAEAMKNLTRLLECPEDMDNAEKIPHMENQLRTREEELAGWEVDTGTAAKELDKLLDELVPLGEELTAARKKAGRKLAKDVNKELKDLGMPEANFAVELKPLWSGSDKRQLLRVAGNEGLDEVCFVISPNPGEAPSTLAQTASGGEASRVMLAVKSALAAVHCPPTLLFDEIDAGVGGRLGDVLGKKLRELAKERQVIVITHLPQIAACADNHLKVAKQVKDKRTSAVVKKLEGKERIEEIAQMIHGGSASDTTRKQAREMLAAR